MLLPAVPDSFAWVRQPWGDALVCGPLAEVAPHVFTTRQLELRLGGDHAEGWQAIADSLGVDTAHLVRLRQVHGREVVVVQRGGTEGPAKAGHYVLQEGPEADAIVSNDPSTAVAVQAADCVPILMADRRTGAVAAVHAGWRGTAAGAAPAAIKAMTREFGTRPSDLVAAVGPSIGPCCYQVGPELVDAFAAAGHRRERIDRWFVDPLKRGQYVSQGELRLDLWAATGDQLIDAGLNEQNVHMCGLCTSSYLGVFYSFRAEGPATGRLAAAIRSR